MTLYGTELWDALTDEQRIELSKHEVISVARVGLWFEILLMGMLAAHAYDQDPASPHTQYALTEIGDETRHSVMFARWADKYGGSDYRVHPVVHALGKVFRLVAPTGPSMWAGTLVAEELLDRLQREGMADEDLQPLTRMVARIHVIEEARHVRFAREELVRAMDEAHWGAEAVLPPGVRGPRRGDHRAKPDQPEGLRLGGPGPEGGAPGGPGEPAPPADQSAGWARRSCRSSRRSGWSTAPRADLPLRPPGLNGRTARRTTTPPSGSDGGVGVGAVRAAASASRGARCACRSSGRTCSSPEPVRVVTPVLLGDVVAVLAHLARQGDLRSDVGGCHGGPLSLLDDC